MFSATLLSSTVKMATWFRNSWKFSKISIILILDGKCPFWTDFRNANSGYWVGHSDDQVDSFGIRKNDFQSTASLRSKRSVTCCQSVWALNFRTEIDVLNWRERGNSYEIEFLWNRINWNDFDRSTPELLLKNLQGSSPIGETQVSIQWRCLVIPNLLLNKK